MFLKTKTTISKMLGSLSKLIPWSDAVITSSAVKVTHSMAPNSNVNVTAPTVTGYTFVCWVNISTQGWVGSLYFEDPGAQTTKVWCASAIAGGSGGATWCRALYRKNNPF